MKMGVNYLNFVFRIEVETKSKYRILNSVFQFIKNTKWHFGYTDLETITCRAPQGSILGPLLFLIFVNDLHKVTKYLDPIMFADDTNLFYSHKNITTLFQIVNSELKLVHEWFLANKLSLNAKKIYIYIYFIKCQCVILSRRSCQLGHSITSKLKEKILSNF